jgi:type I restriction enzyme R subunit
MNKKDLSETDIRSKFITPAITAPGKWDLVTQVREEVVFTKGRILVRGKMTTRGETKKADYVLYYLPNRPLAVVEAKDNNHSVGDGMQQALGYAEALDIPFVYSSNGDGFLEHDRTAAGGIVEREIPLDQFPSPAELWTRYCTAKGLTPAQELVVTQEYFDDGSAKSPRYYQTVAINRTVDAIAQGQRRLLLVMATGTGKTFTAFQIIWRLWKSGAKKRILFLVDRNILADQTRTNDFRPFGTALTKITNRQANKAYEIYIALYQAVTGTDEVANIYKQFSPDFFDLVIIDECHRGSAAEDAAWRQVLEYFSAATQIGLTATPKETTEVSNIAYFGEPIYTYSLKQGIDDGFLAPYKVVRIGLDKDLDGWRPEKGQRDRDGQLIPDREYNARDFDREVILTKRTEVVANKITTFLKQTGDRYQKTIVFCENIDHAERMRKALVNANADLAAGDSKYVMRITGDNEEGKAQLDNFIDPEKSHPVIAVTSKLMSTGIDAQTCRLIVLDQRIQSMTEFKQIIGRGTRVREDYGKLFFTIMDFKQATSLFADPDFDGKPVQVYEPKDGQPLDPPMTEEDEAAAVEVGPGDQILIDARRAAEPRSPYTVDTVPVTVATERVMYLDANGSLITESLKDYTRKSILGSFANLDAFLARWQGAERKQVVIDELLAHGVFLDEVAAMVGRDYDAFDLICHVAFDRPPLTRRERAAQVRKRDVFARFGEPARAVLAALLDKYCEAGISSLESLDILKVDPLRGFGTPLEILKRFGGKDQYLQALRELEVALYPPSAA